MEVGRLKRAEVTGSWRGEFTAARRSQRGSASLLHLLAVHFLRHRKSSLQEKTNRKTDRHTHKHILSHTFKTIFNGFCFSTVFLSWNFFYGANSLHIDSILLNVKIREAGDEAAEDQLSFAPVNCFSHGGDVIPQGQVSGDSC